MNHMKHVNLLIPEELYKKVRLEAFENEVNFSEMVRRIIKSHYEKSDR